MILELLKQKYREFFQEFKNCEIEIVKDFRILHRKFCANLSPLWREELPAFARVLPATTSL